MIMRYLIILFLSFFSISAFSQGIYNKAATNIKQNRLMADSVLGVPRDTSSTNNATFNGAPVGDSGRIAYQYGKFWGNNGLQWLNLQYASGASVLPENRFTFQGWTPSYRSTYNASEGGVLWLGGDTVINIFRLDSARQHAGGKGQIVKRLSYDAGKTWTNPTVVYDSEYDDRNISLGVTDAGRIMVLFRRYSGNNTSGTTVDHGSIYSDNNGATWSSYTTYSSTLTNPANIGPIVKGGDGNYHCTLYAADRTDIVESTDGSTWVIQSTAFDYSADAKQTSESVISYIGGGRMIMLTRDEGSPDGPNYQHVSSDNGDTWTFLGSTNLNRGVTGYNKTPSFMYWDEERDLLIGISTTRNVPGVSPFIYRLDSAFIYVNNPDDVFSSPTAWSMKVAMIRPQPQQFSPFYGYPFLTKNKVKGNYVGVISEISGIGIADQSGSYEYDFLYQFDIQSSDLYSPGFLDTTRYVGLTPVSNTFTGLFDNKSNVSPLTVGLDSVATFFPAGTARFGTIQNMPTLDGFQLVDNNMIRILRFMSDGKIAMGRPLSNAGALLPSWADGASFLNELRFFNATTGAENARVTNSGLWYLGIFSGADRINIGGNGNISGNWAVGGNNTVTGEVRTSIINPNTSSGNLKSYGGATSGFQGGTQTLYGGTAGGGNAGSIAWGVGVTGGGVTQPVMMRLSAVGSLSVGGDAPTSFLDVRGRGAFSVSTVTVSTNLTAANSTILANNSANIVLNLPAAATCPGAIYAIKKISNNAFTVGLDPNGTENIEGSSTTYNITSYLQAVVIQSDGTSWWITY